MKPIRPFARLARGALALGALVLLAGGQAFADGPMAPEEHDFAGGKLTISQKEEYGEKTLSFDGRELATAYEVFFDRIVTIGGVDVALVDAGPGGNACGPASVIVWKPEDGAVRSVTVGEVCGAPPAAVSDSAIYYVPYLLPGGSENALVWTPLEGLTIAGKLSYTPQPGTGWADIDPSTYENIVDAFHNEAVYKAGQALLGADLTDVVTGLLVGGGPETTKSGAFYASGCVPHNCGGADAFMAVDPKAGKLYFAQQSDNPPVKTWPALKAWPRDLAAAMKAAIGR